MKWLKMEERAQGLSYRLGERFQGITVTASVEP